MIGYKELCFSDVMMCDLTESSPQYAEVTIAFLLRKVCHMYVYIAQPCERHPLS